MQAESIRFRLHNDSLVDIGSMLKQIRNGSPPPHSVKLVRENISCRRRACHMHGSGARKEAKQDALGVDGTFMVEKLALRNATLKNRVEPMHAGILQ